MLNKKLDNLIVESYFDSQRVAQDLIKDLNKIYGIYNNTVNKYLVKAYNYAYKEEETDDDLEFIIDINYPIDLIQYRISKNLKYDYIDFIFFIKPEIQLLKSRYHCDVHCIFEMDYQYKKGKFFLIDYGICYDAQPYSF